MAKTNTLKKEEADSIYPSGKIIDISNESYRLYRYQKGETVMIRDPKTLYIDCNGDHKVVDSEEQTHIVKSGWMHLKFVLRTGSVPGLIMEDKK